MALRIAASKYVMVTMPSSSPTFVQAVEVGGDEVSAVQLRDVYKSFGSVQAVRGVDLTVRPGEVLAFLGPNGAGKTSTIDTILGLSQPSAGDVNVYGLTPRHAIAKGLVSAVLQTGGLLKDFTVVETVTYTSKLFADRKAKSDYGLLPDD
jgi:ABC-2 type transport system ATP-binding protein